MKHNPRVNEKIVNLPGIDRMHPLQPEHHIQGLLSIFYEMQEMLAICSGMDQVTLQPVAGAQGGILVCVAYKSIIVRERKSSR